MKTIFLLPLFVFASLFMTDNTFENQVIVSETEAYPVEYDVCIQLVDNQGNPTTNNDIQGYAAYDYQSGSYVYPGRYDADCFYGLAEGTYRFDSYQGYFCGTSSKVVTLSSDLENEDGVIVIELTLWCE